MSPAPEAVSKPDGSSAIARTLTIWKRARRIAGSRPRSARVRLPRWRSPERGRGRVRVQRHPDTREGTSFLVRRAKPWFDECLMSGRGGGRDFPGVLELGFGAVTLESVMIAAARRDLRDLIGALLKLPSAIARRCDWSSSGTCNVLRPASRNLPLKL